jgi:glycosyltransferase involved in cell wall biosynthesis
MRIAIVSYYAPPDPAVAAHRVLRISRTLIKAGHEVHWVTLDETLLLKRDETLASLIPRSIVRHELGGPTLAARPAARSLPEKVLRTLAHKIPTWFTVPDKHVEWAFRLWRRLPKLAVEWDFDAVLLTCGPHGQLLAIPRLRRMSPKTKVFVDYRDLLSGNPWTENTDARVRRRLLQRERQLLQSADALFVNSTEALASFHASLGEMQLPVQVMRNAADYELAKEIEVGRTKSDAPETIRIGFFGTIFPRRRLIPVLQALGRLPEETLCNVTLDVYCDAQGSKDLLDEDLAAVPPSVAERVHRHEYVPYAEALSNMRAMSALLLINGNEPADNVFVPGKLYDYVMARRPILFIGNEGDAQRIVEDTSGSSRCFTHTQTAEIAQAISSLATVTDDLEPVSTYNCEHTFAPLLSMLGTGPKAKDDAAILPPLAEGA